MNVQSGTLYGNQKSDLQIPQISDSEVRLPDTTYFTVLQTDEIQRENKLAQKVKVFR